MEIQNGGKEKEINNKVKGETAEDICFLNLFTLFKIISSLTSALENKPPQS